MGLRLALAALAFSVAFAAAPTSRAGEPAPEAVLADLPFLDAPEEPRRIFIDLAPEGSSRVLRFMLATGAAHTVATPRAAHELGIRVRRTKTDPYRRKTSLGRDVQIFVDTRSSDTASKTGWEYAMLGGNFLRDYVVEIDFLGRRVRFLDPERFEVPEATGASGEAVLPLTMRTTRPGVRLRANGEEVLALVETAFPLPVLLSGGVAAAAAVDDVAQRGLTSHGVLGSTPSEVRVIDELELGPFAFAGFPAVVNPRGWYNQAMSSDSIVGYELLAQFSRVRIDYPRGRLWLERNPQAVPTFDGQPFGALDDAFADEAEPD